MHPDTPVVRRLLTQPRVGLLTGTLATVLGLAPWLMPGAVRPAGVDLGTALLLAVLLAAVVLAYQFPVRLAAYHKVELASIPLYLLVVLLPLPLAPTAVGVAILTAELAVQSRRGTCLSDVATAAGRWIICSLPAALLAHTAGLPGDHLLPLAGAAAILWAGDILTLPLVLAPMGGEPVPAILRRSLREAGPVEAVQYGLGILGALVVGANAWALALLALPALLVYRAFKIAHELPAGTRQLLVSMADMVDLRDPATSGHSQRVADLCVGLLEELGRASLEPIQAGIILAAARVHDIGKIGVPDAILRKPGPLTPAEWAVMQTHAERGAELLMPYPGFAGGAAIVRHHHEHWDGTGYPHRLQGLAIPLGARVIAVADSFDAMTTDRPYHRALSAGRAAEILRAGRGTQWDSAVVDAFLRSIAGRLEAGPRPPLRLVGEVAPPATG